MKVLLVDDEKSMLIIMKRLLSQIEGVEIAGSFQKAANALDFVRDAPVDIAFIDISIAGENGIELARSMLSVRSEMEIVFVTSHREFALDAFDASAFDYIVKPVSLERLERTIDRAARKGNRGARPIVNEIPNRVSVNCLGGMNIGSEQGGAVKWRSSKSAELFAYMLMYKGSSVSKDQVLEDIFRGMPLKNAERYLNTAVYQLRKALASHGLKANVVSVNEQYRLDLAEMDVDFIDFENRAGSLADIDASNYEHACETEKLFGGDLFGGKSYLWALAEKERLSDVYANFAKRLGRWLLENGHFSLAAGIMKKLVGRNELDEEANGLLLQVYAALKDRQSLMRHYDRFAQILQEELGVKPAGDIIRLYAELWSRLD